MRRTKEEAQETRERILDAAELMFFEQGVARSSLEQIAKAAGVTRGAVYWHFRNKIAVLNAVVDRVRMPMENALYDMVETCDRLEDLETLCAEGFAETHRDPQIRRVYTILLLKCEYTAETADLIEREAEVRAKVLAALTRYFERLQAAGRLRSAGDPRLLAIGLHGFLVGLHVDFLRSPDLYRMPADAQRLVALYLDPLKRPAEG